MAVSVGARVARTLRKLKSYVKNEDGSISLKLSNDIDVGEVFGIYRNPSSGCGDVYVCERGICVRNNFDLFVPYSEIDKVIYERISEVIGLRMKDATSHVVRISGRDGNFFDSTAFVRFLDRVIADLKGL